MQCTENIEGAKDLLHEVERAYVCVYGCVAIPSLTDTSLHLSRYNLVAAAEVTQIKTNKRKVNRRGFILIFYYKYDC